MKEQTKKKQESIIKQKKEIGGRFNEFRKLIGKTQTQLANELNVGQSTIAIIESGTTFPSTKYLIYLHHHYHLNPTWLIFGTGLEFVKKKEMEQKSWMKSMLPCHIGNKSPMYKKYLELMDLMRIPLIEQVIMGKLTELKLVAKEEIESFKKNSGTTKLEENAAYK
jgi:transcriptional regulator with XRE-family HTH domain